MFLEKDGSLWWADDDDKEAVKALGKYRSLLTWKQRLMFQLPINAIVVVAVSLFVGFRWSFFLGMMAGSGLQALVSTYLRKKHVRKLKDKARILRLDPSIRKAVVGLIDPSFDDSDIDFMLRYFRADMLFFAGLREDMFRHRSEIGGPVWNEQLRELHRRFDPIVPQVKARVVDAEIDAYRAGARKYLEINRD